MSSPLVTVITAPAQGPIVTHVYLAGGAAAASPLISADPFNRATAGSDGGVYVPNQLATDPLAYYILAKG